MRKVKKRSIYNKNTDPLLKRVWMTKDETSLKVYAHKIDEYKLLGYKLGRICIPIHDERIWMYNDKLNEEAHVRKQLLDIYLKHDYKIGRPSASIDNNLKGKKWINHPNNKKKEKIIDPLLLNKYLNKGWTFGRCKNSISITAKGLQDYWDAIPIGERVYPRANLKWVRNINTGEGMLIHNDIADMYLQRPGWENSIPDSVRKKISDSNKLYCATHISPLLGNYRWMYNLEVEDIKQRYVWVHKKDIERYIEMGYIFGVSESTRIRWINIINNLWRMRKKNKEVEIIKEEIIKAEEIKKVEVKKHSEMMENVHHIQRRCY